MTTLALTNLPLADNWNMHGGGGWAWMALMMPMMLLFWGGIIFGIFWLVRDGGQRRQTGPEETALTILNRRFAEGALSLEDYDERRGVLTGTAAPRTDRDITAESGRS